MEGGVLDEPISQAKDVVIEQRHGTIREQAWDGRVRVEMATSQAEDEFAHEFRHEGATKDERKTGVWVDLSKHTYYFPESLSGFTLGRKRRRRGQASKESEVGFRQGIAQSDSPPAKASRAAEEAARKHGPAR